MYDDKIKERIRNEEKLLNETAEAFHIMAGDDSFAREKGGTTGEVLRYVLNRFSLPLNDIPDSVGTDSEIEEFLQRSGILWRKVGLDKNWWQDTDGLFLVRDNDGRLCAFTPTLFGYREYIPGSRRGSKLRKKRARNLCDYGYCLCRPMPSRSLTQKDLYRHILKELEPTDILLVFVICILLILLGTLVPFANKEIFETVIPSGKAAGILPVFGLLLGAGFATALFGLSRNLLLLRLKDKLNFRMQTAIMARVLSLPLEFFKKSSSAEISSRALSANKMAQALTSQILCTTITALLSFVYIFIIAFFAPSLTLFVTVVIIVYVILVYFRIKANSKRYDEILPEKATIQGFLFNGVTGIHKIKNSGAELRFFTQWANKFKKSEFITGETSFFLRNDTTFSAIFIYACPLLAWFAAYHKGVPTSDAIAFMSAFGIMLAGMDGFLMIIMEFVEVTSGLKLLNPILEAESEDNSEKPVVDYISGMVEVNNVSFRYPGTISPVLDNVSFRIKSGQNVGIVGASGCGKSTLIRLISGMEEATSGSIFYDQYNISKISTRSLRQFVGYCPQRILIFPDTIRNNIKISKPFASDDEIWEAARIAALDEDIRNMANGMDTVLGEGGKGLSGGQCQRILIARAVLSKPSLILFDEATSALDNVTQKKVTDNLSSLHCTRISIAHRLSTLEHCDRILVLDKGKLVEDGSPAELREKKGYFYNMCKRQTL